MFKRNIEKSNGKEKTKMTKKKVFGIIGATIGAIAGVCVGAAAMKSKKESAEVEGEYEEVDAIENTDESDEEAED